MTVAARTAALSLVVHAVEDHGAVCGARPRSSWLPTRRFPVSCPTCLLRLSQPRFAWCRVPVASRPNDRLHVRLVGPKGFKPRSGADTRTLCGRLAFGDESLVGGAGHRPQRSDCCPLCLRSLSQASDGRLDPSNAVR